MNRLHNILFIISVLFFAFSTQAQDNQHGGVIIHSDPRLSLLLNKAHPAPKPQPVERIHTTPERNRQNVKTPVIAEKDHPALASASIPNRPHPMTVAAPVAATPAPAMPVAAKPATAPVSKYYYSERLTTTERGKIIYSGKGFRVQIFNGQDRNKAMDVKLEFMRRYPGVRTYLTYMSPCFRVKVGNYRNRSDAEGMYREMKSMYGPCMIVPDIITISTY